MISEWDFISNKFPFNAEAGAEKTFSPLKNIRFIIDITFLRSFLRSLLRTNISIASKL